MLINVYLTYFLINYKKNIHLIKISIKHYIKAYIIKNVSSSTSHKTTSSSVFTSIRLYAFPKLCERFSARFPLKGRRIFFLRLSMISWGQFYGTERFCNFFKTSQSFDQYKTLTYVLIDNFLSLFLLHLTKKSLYPFV